VQRENLALFFGMLFRPELKDYVERMSKRQTDSAAGFTMTAGRKDLALMLDAAAAVGCPVDIANIVANKMDAAIAQGMEQFDWSAIQEITRQRAGLE
jgi:3-hydroxyisobutyrate dehydrogenase-like beta-hydroxyacid dehydrogenase